MSTPSTPLLGRRLSGRELAVLDAVLAAALVLLCGYAATEAPGGVGVREPEWLSWLVGVVIGGPVAVRRRWPVPATCVVLAATVAAVLTGVIPHYAATGAAAAIACALYLVGVAVPRRTSVRFMLGCAAVTSTVLVLASPAPYTAAGAGEIAFAGLPVVAAWVLGRATRERRAYAARAAERRTERAVGEERLRIARELHDIVAHSMSLIAVKAAVANHVAAERPQEARDALRVIAATSRTALTDMRRTLGVLRAEPSLGPVAEADGLLALAERTRSAGVAVDLSVTGDIAGVPEDISRAVHRIVQEALTNVVKHAAPAACRVTVVVAADEAVVEVVDDGTGTGPPVTGGRGILGMRERVALHRGDFRAGPCPGGGFAVSARLPYRVR